MIWALHGAFGNPADWAQLAGELEAGDAGGLEAVDLWADEHAFPFREWAARFGRDVAGADPAPLLLGYSMGARLGLHALIEAPGLWKGAVLVAPHPGLTDAEERASRRAHDDAWLERLDALPWEAFWRAWSDQPVLRTETPRPTPAYRPAMRRALGTWSLAEQEDLRPRLSGIRCPVLWVTGERDEKFTAIAARAVPSVPRGIHLMVGGSGHRVPWDAPDSLATLVGSFARGCALRDEPGWTAGGSVTPPDVGGPVDGPRSGG